MSNFTFIAIVATCLFVSAVLIVDHIEVARHNRNLYAQELKSKGLSYQSFGEYCNELGLAKDCPIEDLVAASEQWVMIEKIQRTMN
jgi:hypothetical protein